MPEPPTRLEAAYRRYETASGDLESVVRVSAGVSGPEQLVAVQAAHQASVVNLVLESFYEWQKALEKSTRSNYRWMMSLTVVIALSTAAYTVATIYDIATRPRPTPAALTPAAPQSLPAPTRGH